MLGGSRGAEKVGLRTRRQNQKIALILLSFSSFDRTRLRSTDNTVPNFTSTLGCPLRTLRKLKAALVADSPAVATW